MDKEDIKIYTLSLINLFIKKFQNSPFNYLTESDIQGELYTNLKENLSLKVDISSNHNLREMKIMDKSINLVNTEYSNKAFRDRIDIVCYDPDLSTKIVDENKDKQLYEILYGLPILIGIEIKFVPYNEYRMGINICTKDVEKLNKFTENQKEYYGLQLNWLSLCFFHNKKAMENMIDTSGMHFVVGNIDNFNRICLISPELCKWTNNLKLRL